MSLIGKHTAIISLGASCQTAFQLRLNAKLLSAAIGDELTPSRLPFDWTIVPPADAAGWLEADERFPASPDQLIPVADTANAFLWPKHGVRFWHDFKTAEGDVDVAGTFERTRDMYRRHFAKLTDLGKLDQVVAVISNTQNNLGTILPDEASLLYRRQDAVSLKAAFEKLIGRPCRMLCITYGDRRAPGFLSTPKLDITVEWIARDASSWQGSRRLWEKVLTGYFAKSG